MTGGSGIRLTVGTLAGGKLERAAVAACIETSTRSAAALLCASALGRTRDGARDGAGPARGSSTAGAAESHDGAEVAPLGEGCRPTGRPQPSEEL